MIPFCELESDGAIVLDVFVSDIPTETRSQTMREKLRSGSWESHHKDFPFGINGHCGVTIPEPRGSGGAANILIAPDCNSSFNFMNAIVAQFMHTYLLLITLFLSSNTLYVNGGTATGLIPDALTIVCC